MHYLDTEKFSNILSETIENLEKDFIVLKELIQDVLVHNTDPLDPNDHPTPPTSPPAAIPGYHIIIIISIVGWISLVLVRKKKFKLV